MAAELDLDDVAAQSKKAVQELTDLRNDLERERMRLVACGVVAMADTPESAVQARQMHPDYHSASCDNVARRVDECMALRKDAERYRKLRAGNYSHDLARHILNDRPDGIDAAVDALPDRTGANDGR
jgi:hypothetical protein